MTKDSNSGEGAGKGAGGNSGWGFHSPLDLRATNPGEWQLLSPLVYTSKAGGVWIVPKGFITDLASIPRAARILIDRNGPSRPAATLHDYLYATGAVSRAEADSLFLEALEAASVSWVTRRLMHSAVRVAGWMFYRGE